jgi:C1A family cysteine protease/chitodextrinase
MSRHQTILLSIIALLIIFSPVAAQNSENCSHISLSDPIIGISMAPINPEFLRYSEERGERTLFLKPSEEQATGFIPSPVDFSYTKGMHITQENSIQRLFETPRFDLRDEGRVSSVKDQGTEGTCWAFATYGSLESFLLPDEEWDFSENNMKNLLKPIYPQGFDNDDGGDNYMSTAYLARGSGPVPEEDDPYQAGRTYSPQDLPPVKRVQTVYFYPLRDGDLDIGMLKSAIREFGALFVAISYQNSAYNPETFAFYSAITKEANHAVIITGWDDTFSRTNFSTQPQDDGAFIVRNSWGTEWGDNGYFYISYNDVNLDFPVIFTAVETDAYDRVYQYDPLGLVSKIGFSSETAWFANTFTAESDESLTAVGFYTPTLNTTYQIEISTNLTEGAVKSGEVASSAEGTITLPGYHTIEIPEVQLETGEQFSVIVRLKTPGYTFPIPIERPLKDYSSKATANPGEGYISSNGVDWIDLTTQYKNASVCLKAFTTVSSIPGAAFSANVTSGDAPLAVAFTDASTGTPTAWYWDFGDGAGSRVTKPTHTYTRPGEYTVNLTISNSQGQDSEVKTGYITVAGDQVEISVLPADSTLRVGETQEYHIVLSSLPDGLGSFDGDINLTEPGIARITGLNITEGTGNYSALPAESVSCWSMTHIPPDTENCTIVTLSLLGVSEGTTNLTITRAYLWPEYDTVVIPAVICIEEASAPTANFTANVTQGYAPLAIQFNDTSTGDPTSWLWQFGDGTTSSGQHPAKTFTATGTYNVSLTALNNGGSNTITKTEYISVHLRADFNRNNRIDIGDVAKVAWMAAGRIPEDLEADFNGDGHVTGADAARIAYFYVGRITHL